MPRQYFYGVDQEWLEKQLQRANQDQARGQRFMEVESGGNRGRKEGVLSIDEVISRLLNDLSLLDPETYPPAGIQRIGRTKAVSYNG